MTAWQGIPSRWNPLHNKPLSREKKPSSPGNLTGVQVNHRPGSVMKEYSEARERNNQTVRRSGPGVPCRWRTFYAERPPHPLSLLFFALRNLRGMTLAYASLNEQQTGAGKDDFTVERYRQLARHLPHPCRKILDLGCCTGVGGAAIKSLRPELELHGLDCSEARLAQLPSVYQGRHQGDVTRLPFEDGEYDAVLMGEFIEHLYPRDVDPCLQEVQRILAVGGRILLTTPNPAGWKKRWLRQTVYTTSHLSQHFASVLSLRLRMAGFDHIRVLGSGRMTRFFPEWVPLKNLFGSLLYRGDKV